MACFYLPSTSLTGCGLEERIQCPQRTGEVLPLALLWPPWRRPSGPTERDRKTIYFLEITDGVLYWALAGISTYFFFISQVLSYIRLVIGHDPSRVQLPAVLRRLGGNAKAQGYVCHGEDDHTLVLRGIFRDSTQSNFRDMIPIEEAHFGRWFHPHLFPKGHSRPFHTEVSSFRIVSFVFFRRGATSFAALSIGTSNHHLFILKTEV
mmetsp:Transcript_5980/g.37091  ORF Transcript_5980/g.37091 Transcript_5980/m.37091 type:complete len:207 (-) Transcript_5980:546-1166(-)